MTEIWRPFVKGWYEVSSIGRVRSVDRCGIDGRRWSGKILKLAFDRYYMYFCMSIDGKRTHVRIHNAVAHCFLGKRPAGKETDHKEGDKFNNRASNLEYKTHKKNQEMAASLGLMPTKKNGRWVRKWRP